MKSFHLSLFVKFLAAGIIVSTATWFAVQGRTTLAALVGVFPFITFLTVMFTYIETKDLARIEILAGHFGVMLVATAIFPFGLNLCLKQGMSLFASIVIPIQVMVAVQLGIFHYIGRSA